MAQYTDWVSGSIKRFLNERTRLENRAALRDEVTGLTAEWAASTYQQLLVIPERDQLEESMIKFLDNVEVDEEGTQFLAAQMIIGLKTIVKSYDDKNEGDRLRRQKKRGNAIADKCAAGKRKRIIDSDEEEENFPKDLDRKYNLVIHEIFQKMKVSQENNNDSDILLIRDLENKAADFEPEVSLDPETFHKWVTHKFESFKAFAELTPEWLNKHFPLAEHVPADAGGPAPPGARLKKRDEHRVLSDSDASDGEPAQGGPKAPKEARAAVSAPTQFPEDMGVPMTIPEEVFGDTDVEVYKMLGYVPAPPPCD